MEDKGTQVSLANILITAVIAFVGVVVSGVFSYIVAKRYTSHRFNELLYQARLTAYPELYSIVSTLSKELQHKTIDFPLIKRTAKQLNDWDSAHAILLSGRSGDAVSALRFYLQDQLKIQKLEKIEKLSKELSPKIAELEHSIKIELGVFSLKEFHSPKAEEYELRITKNKFTRGVRNTLRKVLYKKIGKQVSHHEISERNQTDE